MKKAFDVSDLIIFISEAVKQSFINKFDLKDKKTVVIYNGINEEFFYNQIKEKNSNIIFVGRLVKSKGIDLLLKAFEVVCNQKPEVKLTIVGDGEKRNSLEKMALNMKCKENIKFMGRQQNVIQMLDDNGIFVYPSICEEGFGISVVEAMARGCVPITFRKGGLVEIINSGVNGYLVDEVNSEALANKIIEVLNTDLNQIRTNAIEASKEYTIINTIKRIEEEYKKL